MDGFSFSTDVRIRFAETDAQGIAHHASFVVWLEVARVAYLAQHAGGYQAIRDRGLEALTTEVCLRYHRAAYFDETPPRLDALRRPPRRALHLRVPHRAGRRARRRRLLEARRRGSRDVPTDPRARLARRGDRYGRGVVGVVVGVVVSRASVVGGVSFFGFFGFATTFVPTRTIRVSPS